MSNKIFYLFLLFISISLINNAQVGEKKCLCTLLENTEENDKKVIELAEYVEASFHEYNIDAFIEKFNTSTFGDYIVNNNSIEKNDSYTKGFLEGLSKVIDKLPKKIINEMKNGSIYNLISYQYNIVEQAYYFTFRIYSEETGINYHDYKVCSDGDNIMISDIYIYLTGEHLSETLQRIFLASRPSKNVISKLFGVEQDNSILIAINAQRLSQEGKFKEAYDKISEVKGKFAKDKFYLILKGNIASQFDHKLYEENLYEFSKLFPNDPTLYLKQIDYYTLKENYPMVQEKIDRLIFETEDDFLNLFKARVYLLEEDYEKSDFHFKYMIENYPDFVESYIGYINSLTYQKRFDEALKIIDSLIEKGYEKNALIEFFEEKEEDGSNSLELLVESKAYKKWKN